MKNNLILFHSLLNEDYDSFVNKVFHYKLLINNSNENGETMLHYCCHYGMIEKFYALINFGATVTETKEGNNLLHYACHAGKDDFLVLELIKMGLNPTKKNNNGETVFHSISNEKVAHYLNLWAQRNNVKIVDLIDNDLNNVAHGCKINGNINGALYWVKNYPILEDGLNCFGKKWNQLKRKNVKRCLY